MEKPYNQNFEHHARIVPLFHLGVFGVFFVNFVYSIYRLVRYTSYHAAMELLMAMALLLLFFYARMFALTVQDRVIRLEERLRMERLLPANLQPRIGEFTVPQLVGLRFASDEELPELARRVLEEKIADRKAVKKLVKKWRPDFERA